MQDWLRQLAPDTPVKWWPNPVFNELVAVKVPTELREPIVLYLGVLLPAKGLMDLVDAFAQLHASDPSARLVIGGTGPEQQALDKRVVELNLQDCVVFLGWINVEQKASWLSRARVLALASHLEAQPMVLLEAMASGAVVVSTNVGGIPDLIENNVQGLLVPPHDVNAFSQALQSLWHDVPLRQRLSASAHQLVLKRHKADEACNALRQLYQEMEEQS
jgi:glycosyltransferase involved in cell wall biosynthesis